MKLHEIKFENLQTKLRVWGVSSSLIFNGLRHAETEEG